MVEAIPNYAMVLAGNDNIDFKSWCLLFIKGSVFVNRNDKKSRKRAKEKMIQVLKRGTSLIIFPESTWNMSPNKLHLPLNWGCIDIARKSGGAAIVLVAQEYFYDESVLDGKEHIEKVHVRFGKPLLISTKDSMEEQLAQLEEAFATVRWSIWEEQIRTKRKDIPDMLYANYLQSKIDSFVGDVDEEQHFIYGASDEFYQYHWINMVKCDAQGRCVKKSWI